MAKKNILTYEGLRKLEDELQDLKVVKRREIAQKIKEAREQGDLSENAEYDAAKDEQRDIEARIEEIELILKNAEVVVEDEVDLDKISVGCKVRILDIEFDEELDKYVPKMIYRNDVLGNPLVKGAKVLCRNFEFDISHVWIIGYFNGETTDKRFPYIVMVDGNITAYSDCLAYTDSTKILEGFCTRYISKQWQLDAAIKELK